MLLCTKDHTFPRALRAHVTRVMSHQIAEYLLYPAPTHIIDYYKELLSFSYHPYFAFIVSTGSACILLFIKTTVHLFKIVNNQR